MLRIFLALLFLSITAASPTRAQSADPADGVRQSIDALFDAMRAGDSTAVREVFAEGATLETAQSADDGSETGPTVRSTPIARFAEAVGQPKEQVWDERIWDVEIRVDGPMASAWVPYAFYLGETLQHCGVNAIQFVRHADGWKMLHLIDTRTPAEACDLPASVTNPEG